MKQTLDKISLAATDLSNFLSCRHLSSLDLRAAQGQLEKPARYGAMIDELRTRGIEHESAYLAWLKAPGLSVAGDGDMSSDGGATGIDETLSAMRSGVDVIYQATLSNDAWFGRVDFLRKVSVPSDLGEWSYEVYDTKLARETKAGTILQLCVYSYLLENIQGTRPGYIHVVTPGNDFEPRSFRLDDCSAYFRYLEQGFDDFVARPTTTYPEVVSHCEYCSWWAQCEQRRRDDDHLCYVAGISSNQTKALRALGVDRLAELAALEPVPEPPQGSKEALVRARDQARMQQRSRESGTPCHELKEPFNDQHGLALLPAPTPDDIFLDFEGNHFAEDGVHEYLVGYVMQGPQGEPIYTAIWATTLEEERAAFQRFMELATGIRARNPNAHIYHFAPYEPSALKRLMGRYATHAVELDALLRGNAFVDLYAVVKRALVASVERYSIKDLEVFFCYERKQDLREASMSRRIVENAIEAGDLDEQIEPHLRAVEDYNREDCESASRLRDWLEQLRADAIEQGHELLRPVPGSEEASEAVSELDRELQELRDALLEGVPLGPDERSPEQQARFTLAHMMEFHRREDKASWWEYFRVLGLESSEFADERRAITGLAFEEVLDPKRAQLQSYRYPSQELDARQGDTVYDTEGRKLGTVDSVNVAEGMISIKKMVATNDEHPSSVVLHNQVPAKALRESLMRFGQFVLDSGFAAMAPYRASLDLLLRRAPPGGQTEGSLQGTGETTDEAACRIALILDGNVLAIQGPPGTGKTYTGAKVICTLVRAGRKVGVTAVSHKVVVNLLEAAAKEARDQGLSMALVHRQKGVYEGEWGITRIEKYDSIRRGLESGSIDVLGATAWCWSRPDFEQSVDVLIVDEAGQMSLSNVLAAAPAGRSLMLLGDPEPVNDFETLTWSIY